MSETEMNIQFDMPKNRSNVIKVIGVGGGGSNAINYMFQQGIKGVDFVVCNTDSQALENSPVPSKVQLGVNLTEGLGAGANPNIGEQAALESFEDLKNLLDTNTKMLFITAGMGGGTGTGAAPIIAKQAREMDILTVGIVTIPFKFEGRARNEQARAGLEKLRKNVDSLIVIDNNKLREVYGNLGFKSGFSKADEVLATASKGIAEVITHHYTQNIDLRDAKTVLSNSGTAIMGSASASGGDRAQVAITKALDSPLLNDNKITGAQNVLLLIVSGTEEITLDEIGEINDHIQAEAGNNANIIMGVGEDEDLGEAIAVTIIATGFPPEQQGHIANTESKKIIHTLEDEQRAVHNLTPENSGITSVSKGRIQPEPEMKYEEEDQKIVHTLDDSFEEESYKDESKADLKLIPTSEIIKSIEVNYQEVVYDEDDFIFIDTDSVEESTTSKTQSSVEREESLFDFDMPLPKKQAESKPTKNQRQHQPRNLYDEVEDIEVEEPITLFPNSSKNEVKRYRLEDYLEKEKELTEAKPEPKEEPRLVRNQSQQAQPEPQPRPQENRGKEIKVEEDEELGEEIDPLNSPISEELIARAAERRAKMKKFNYKFRKSANIDEYEKQPAYKRAGLDLSDGNVSNRDNMMSRSSLSDEEGNPQIRSNNSFLHDNVD